MVLQQLLDITIARRASDLHLVAGYPPSIRVDTEILPIEGASPLSAAEIEALILPVLSPTQKQIFESTFELDFGFTYADKVRFRANVYREQGYTAVALRLIPLIIPKLEDLGLPDVVSELPNLRQGLVLVTGPTGHGKSTTLAAFINKINQSRSEHIITIEDPIEYIYPPGRSVISQREMYLDTKSWDAALRASLREDPDVVLVGEMRDLETISAAITVAETGHLVFGTLHTNSAAQCIDRMIDVFPENQQMQVRLQLSAVLEAVVSQRLVPTIEPGRVVATEILLKTPALAELIRSAKTHLIDNLILTSAELGMVSLEGSLANLVKGGRISFEVAQEYSLRPALLAKLLSR